MSKGVRTGELAVRQVGAAEERQRYRYGGQWQRGRGSAAPAGRDREMAGRHDVSRELDHT